MYSKENSTSLDHTILCCYSTLQHSCNINKHNYSTLQHSCNINKHNYSTLQHSCNINKHNYSTLQHSCNINKHTVEHSIHKVLWVNLTKHHVQYNISSSCMQPHSLGLTAHIYIVCFIQPHPVYFFRWNHIKVNKIRSSRAWVTVRMSLIGHVEYLDTQYLITWDRNHRGSNSMLWKAVSCT